MIRYVKVRSGMVRYVMVRYGMISGMVWSGMV